MKEKLLLFALKLNFKDNLLCGTVLLVWDGQCQELSFCDYVLYVPFLWSVYLVLLSNVEISHRMGTRR